MKKRLDNASNEDRWARLRTLNELAAAQTLYPNRFSSNIHLANDRPSMGTKGNILQRGR